MTLTRRDRYWLGLIGILVFVCVDQVRTRHRLERRVNELRVFELRVRAVDDRDGSPINGFDCSVSPETSGDQIMGQGGNGAGPASEIRVKFIGNLPFHGSVTAHAGGFERQTARFDSDMKPVIIRFKPKP